jgi:hypothetical protein
MNLEKFQYGSSNGLSLVIEKHGTHDQKTHGNWATGASMGEGVASSILERVKANGGLSVNMVDGSEPTSGYMVAKGSQYGSIASEADFYDPVKGPKILADYMKKNKSDLATGKNYLGLWHNTADGQVYLDISENIQDVDTARTLGAERDQISIWDVANFAEIETGGTGNVGKTRGSETARHLEDDGRGNRPVRPTTLGKIGKALKVIRFEAGLIPVLKHDAGGHDQASHGNWARGVSAEDEALIDQMSSMGPSKEDILNALVDAEQPDMSDLEMMVSNDMGLYEQAIDGIDERVDAEMAEFGWDDTTKHDADFIERQRNQVYEEMQNQMINDFIENDDGTLASLWQEENGGGDFNPEDLHSPMDEVYAISHNVTNNAGEVITTLDSSTTNIYRDGERLVIQGQVSDSDGNFAGEFQRSFYKEINDNGEEILVVEHDLLRMADEYQGSGFGKAFLAQQEAYYVSKEIDAINVGTAWDGARHWARAGFDFNPQYLDDNIRQLSRRVSSGVYDVAKFGTPEREEFDAIMSRAVNDYESTESGIRYSSVKEIREDNFPIPNDFAMIGYGRRTQTGVDDNDKPQYTWAGKELLADMNLKYRKGLTQEGRTINQGPIDRDGDGLVYDGTAREKPAPTVNSTP